MVNTFVLTNCPKETMKLLDTKRLGKQRVEAKQIINVIENKDGSVGWKNHPIVKMWENHVDGLKYYFNCAVDEWILRGYKNTMEKYEIKEVDDPLPWWFFNKQVQMSHKMSLLRKDPGYYSKYFNEDPEYYNFGYVWTCKLGDSIVSEMKISEVNPKLICEPIGTGAPAQFRYSKEEVEEWRKNKNVNPKTQHKISETGTIYKDLAKAEKYYFN